MADFFDRVGIQFKDLIYDCKYRGEACRQSDFKVTFTEYGKCYTFNQPKDLRQLKDTLKGGLDNGLELILNAQQEDHLPIFRETENINFESGIKIHIHDPIEPNFIKELGFGVVPGKQTMVSIQEQRITFLPPPWGVCDSGTDKNDYRFYDTYSISRFVINNQL